MNDSEKSFLLFPIRYGMHVAFIDTFMRTYYRVHAAQTQQI